MFTTRIHGRIVFSRFESKALHGNPLGDPHARDVVVYLPPQYDSADQRFPLVLMLPAFGASHYSPLSFSPWKRNTLEALDDQMVSGVCPPAIVAIPDCMTRWGGSQFVDSPATGLYQTYLAEEVVAHLDANFRTIAQKESRAAVGRSSGGFGALRLATDRPDLLRVVASHAGDAAFDRSMRPMLMHAAIAIAQAGGLEAFAARVVDGGPRGGFEFDAIFVLAASAAYAATKLDPLPFCDLPIDIQSGDVVDEVWQQWLRHDPLIRLSTAVHLREMSLIYLDAGDRDEHGLHYAARALETELRSLGAPVELEEYEGGHRGTSYRYETSLPKVIGALQR